MLLTSLVNIGSNGVLRQTLGRSYKHCGAAGELWGNFGSNWVLDTGYWQETIKNIDKRGNFGEHYKHWGAMAGAGARSLFLLKVQVHTAISALHRLSLSRFPKDVQC